MIQSKYEEIYLNVMSRIKKEKRQIVMELDP